jgi:hypothetical protein
VFNGDAVLWVREGAKSLDLGNFVGKGYEKDGMDRNGSAWQMARNGGVGGGGGG